MDLTISQFLWYKDDFFRVFLATLFAASYSNVNVTHRLSVTSGF
jgi:hypothetical protein